MLEEHVFRNPDFLTLHLQHKIFVYPLQEAGLPCIRAITRIGTRPSSL